MIVVKPIPVIDSNLMSSTIPEPDASLGEVLWVPGTYVTGVRRISATTHRIYEVVATPDTTIDPEIGVDTDPPSWVDVGPTNRFAMFDTTNSSQTLDGSQLIIEIMPGELFNAVAGFNIEGADDINVMVEDPTAGTVYDRDVDMNDNSEVTDWYNYFFSPIVNRREFILLDLPTFPQATLKVTVNGTDIKFGNFVLGNQFLLGVANLGTSVQLLDFSRKEQDAFGNIVVVPGRTSKLVEFDVTIQTVKVTNVFNILASLTTVPAVWIGTSDIENINDIINTTTLVFGYYRDYQNNISSYQITQATITVEGLV